MECGANKRGRDRNDGLTGGEKELDGILAEPIDEEKDVEPVDNDWVSRTDKVDENVRNTGLRTVRSLVNGGLALFALGALSPVGLLLKHLDDMKSDKDDSGSENRDNEVEKSTVDDNDL
ncbi:unnamed protein product [Aureobasidium vineae]|uniref:Uncharacterized protein n=1 Tax=Aureobasidium vineae TaxID=2773715 RepID=A0A9N8PJZ4_9PEZI|nr:unnamed protein product [Aureobasidium vineae]